MSRRSLIVYAKDAEDVASGLRSFRDQLPRNATRITACIGELFALSAILREIENAEGDVQFAVSFYQVHRDLTLLVPGFQRSMDDAFDMFARSRDRSYQAVWDDLTNKMDRDEGLGFLERLYLYHHFLRGQADVLQRRRPQRQEQLRNQLIILWEAQQASVVRAGRRAIDNSAASTPRQRPVRPRRPSRIEVPTSPLSPTSGSESWSDYVNMGSQLPEAPEPPRVPLSPTHTYASNSTPTFSSSQTSYSSDQNGALVPRYVHWAQNVFDGENPRTPFYKEFQLEIKSSCHGPADPQYMEHLRRDSFVQALEIPFDREQCRVRLYFRPNDSRARILFISRDSRGRELLYSTKLVNLKIVRQSSSLQLCRAAGQGSYSEWGRLNFYLYERMVLFYCTFVAMKRQDSHNVPHDDLLDTFELEGRAEDVDELQEFGGVIKHDGLQHALRLYRDQSSGVVRLEACALRGPMKDVPLWTAFMTRYAQDPDHVHYEGEGVVSFAALRPPPYVFLAGYQPLKNRKGEYILKFTSDTDAQEFVETWTGLCRSYHG